MEPGMDCEFVDLIDQISANISRLNSAEETQLVDLWITRLSEEPDKEIRNDYCRQLNKLMKSGKLRYPFSKIPPAGRLPLYEDIVNPNLNSLAPRRRFQELSDGRTLDSDYQSTVQEFCPPCQPFCEPIDKCLDQPEPIDLAKSIFEKSMIEKSMLCNTDTYKEQVDKLISAICPTTLLEEFASQVGRFTCDNGKLMFKIISRETNVFRELVRSIYESRNSDVSRTLNQEQKRVKDNFEKLEGRLLAKTQEEMTQIRNAIPDFSWEELAIDEKYVWNKLYPKMKLEFEECAKLGKEERQGGVQRKFWLKEIARQLQEDNAERRAELKQLSNLLTSLTVSYACSQNKLSEHIAMMESEANLLKNRIIENQKIIENMLNKIQSFQKA
ncbi:uncharacterized protein isoform X2 [Rhodnius prolixus]|uniref:uncharacterized protein isoform X2 n=1 Tax=Rhodnius prolixus TaxID=13249 RepID=UPI003D18E2E7